MSTKSSNPSRFLVALVAVLFVILLGVTLHLGSQINQRELELEQSAAVNKIISDEVENREARIVELEGRLEGLEYEISNLEQDLEQVSFEKQALEEDVLGRSCRSVSYEEFDRRIRLGTNYVVTTAEMGWTSYWSLRTDVLFENAASRARGYEVRYDLTPTDYSDDWQELHTTIRAFSTPEAAMAFFESKGSNDDSLVLESSLDLGVPVKAWYQASDPERTVAMSFVCDHIQADIKLKLLEDSEQALAYVEQAVRMLFHDVSVWEPFEIAE